MSLSPGSPIRLTGKVAVKFRDDPVPVHAGQDFPSGRGLSIRSAVPRLAWGAAAHNLSSAWFQDVQSSFFNPVMKEV